MLKSITSSACEFVVGNCLLIAPRGSVEFALKLAGFSGSVSFDTPITVSYGNTYPVRRRMSGSPDYLEVGIGWLVDYRGILAAVRELELSQQKAANKPVHSHPLPVGTRIVSILGELDSDEKDNDREAPPGSVGKVEGMERLKLATVWNYRVTFPSGTWVFLNERELADDSRYTILPEEPCPNSNQATP